MEKKLFVVLVTGVSIVIMTGLAKANTIVMNFTASGFTSFYNGTQGPVDPVSGSITWEAASVTAPIQNFTDINLTIDAHQYSVGDLVGCDSQETRMIGLDGYTEPNTIDLANGVDLFWIVLHSNGDPWQFDYMTASSDDLYLTSNFDKFELTDATAPVPEPATMLLFGTGIVGFAGTRIRRKKA